MTINLSQFILDFDVCRLTSQTDGVIPTKGRNLESQYNLSNKISLQIAPCVTLLHAVHGIMHCPTSCVNHREVVNTDIARSNISVHTSRPAGRNDSSINSTFEKY